MNSTLKDLFNGSLMPWERNFANYECYRRASREVLELHEQVDKALSKDQLDLVNRLTDACTQLSAIEEEIMFTNGFRLGMKISAECFINGEC